MTNSRGQDLPANFIVSDRERTEGGISDESMVAQKVFKEASSEKAWSEHSSTSMTSGFVGFRGLLLYGIDSLIYRLQRVRSRLSISGEELASKMPRLSKDALPFVNRVQSMCQLIKCFSEMKERAINKFGSMWPIPIVDAPSGMGKTRFGSNIVDQVKERKPEFHSLLQGILPGLIDELSDAVSIVVTLGPGELAKCNFDFERVVLERLKAELDITEDESKFTSVTLFLKAVVRRWKRPIMICFDEVPRACRIARDTTESAIGVFHRFTYDILVPMAELERVFFIVCGRDNIMSRIGLRTGSEGFDVSSPVRYVRIHLNPIRPEYIKELVSRTKSRTLERFRSLPTHQLDEFVWNVFCVSSGHPRSIREILHSDYPERLHQMDMQSVWPIDDIRNAITQYPEAVSRLHECHTKSAAFRDSMPTPQPLRIYNGLEFKDGAMDLTLRINESILKSPTYQYVANALFAGYGMNLQQSFVQIPPFVVNIIEMMQFTLYDYCMRLVNSSIRDFDYSLIMEKIMMKFFQSVLSSPTRRPLSDILGPFLPGNSVLAHLLLRLQRKGYDSIPRVLNREQSRSIDTIDRESCQKMLKQFAAEAPVIILPFEKSHSPDVLLFPQTMLVGSEGSLEPVADSQVIMGIAVKNYARTEMTSRMIDEERDKFLKIVPLETNIIPVLLICATSYASEIQELFEGGARSHIYSNEDIEVVIIRIDSPAYRREFFAKVSQNDVFLSVIESVIVKDIQRKGQRQQLSPVLVRREPKTFDENNTEPTEFTST